MGAATAFYDLYSQHMHDIERQRQVILAEFVAIIRYEETVRTEREKWVQELAGGKC